MTGVLDRGETATRVEALADAAITWGRVPMVAAISILSALLVPARVESGRWLGLPGCVYLSLSIVIAVVLRRARAAARRP